MRIKVVAYLPHNDVPNSGPGNIVDIPDALAAVWIKNNWAIPAKPPPPPKIEPVVVEPTPLSPLEEALLTHGGVREVSEIIDEPEESTEDKPEEEPEEETDDSKKESDDMAKSIEFAVKRVVPERALSRRGRKRKV